jgi:hypothetical protein
MSIYKQLLEVQKKVSAISKTSLNPHFKNKYFDINDILREVKPILTESKLVLTQPLKDGLVCSIITDVESGEQVESCLPYNINEVNPQKIGSQLTYYRRYTLSGLISLEGEDDDAELAKKPTESQLKEQKQNDDLIIESFRVKILDCKTKDELVSLWSDMPKIATTAHKDLVAKTSNDLKS